MTEGSLYDRELAALAIKQARGDLIEAIFLLRAYRTTLPRLGLSQPIDTDGMAIRRRISATFKDLPGGQMLGADVRLHAPASRFRSGDARRRPPGDADPEPAEPEILPPRRRLAALSRMPRVVELLDREGLIEPEEPDAERRAVGDLTREPLDFPAGRDVAAAEPGAGGRRASCWRSATPPSAATGGTIPSRVRSALGEVAVELVPGGARASRSRSARSR